MAPRTRSIAPRLAALAAGACAFRYFNADAPAYAVKGSWEGGVQEVVKGVKGDVQEFFLGLEPDVSFPALSYQKDGVTLSVDDGKVNADYTNKIDDKTLNLKMDDAQAWSAGLNNGVTSLRVLGKGFKKQRLAWEASEKGHANGVGDVNVEFNSNKQYNLTVARSQLDKIFNVAIDSTVTATNGGLTGRVDAHRQVGTADLTYNVESPVGVYDVRKWSHDVKVRESVAGGDAVLQLRSDGYTQSIFTSFARELRGGNAKVQVSRQGPDRGFRASYSRSLNDLTSANVDADIDLGVDEAGAYAMLTTQRDLGTDLKSEYVARARVDRELGQLFKHSVKVSNKLGYAQLVHGKNIAPRLRLGYEFEA